MNINPSCCVNYSGYQSQKVRNDAKVKQNASNPSFSSRYGEHKDTERTPWGTTWGEERVAREAGEAKKRLIQRETLKRSEDAWVREEAKNVGKNPAWDEFLTQREFDRYHKREMEKRAEKEAKLAAAAGIKNYDDNGNYTVCDRNGRVVEEGNGDGWTKRFQYDIIYPVARFGENYTINGAVKEVRPDNTYVVKSSPYSDLRLEEKFKNESVEYVDNCTSRIKSVKLPNGDKFSLPSILLNVKQTENSRQYFSQYNDKNVILEVFDDGSYVKAGK